MTNRQLFQQHVAQTSPTPLALEIVRAEGRYLYDTEGNTFLDLIGGISVCNIGHSHPLVLKAIREQSEKYLHIMVYGELVQSPQVQYAALLAAHMPETLNCVYFTNSGSEATEGAIKLARRATGRTDIIACNNSYHGHSMGALSVMGDEYWRNAFRPLLPGVWHYAYNSDELIEAVNENTSCVIIETIQGEAGVIEPQNNWLQRLRERCTEKGALLVLDEIQCGFGRTGMLWGFQHYGIVPDVVLLGKALGGGLPMGAFVAGKDIMSLFTHNPVLGHITTFGGHPLCCAAGMAAFKVLMDEDIMQTVEKKAGLFRSLLVHPAVTAIRNKGLLMALNFDSDATVQRIITKCLTKGVFTDWFLFAPHCMRIAPPLTITDEEITQACKILLWAMD